MNLTDEQPAPIANDRPATWSLVIADAHAIFRTFEGADPATTAMIDDMEGRDRKGRLRYGMPLTAHNGRNSLVDAYQELLDACVYLRNDIAESGCNTPIVVQQFYRECLHFTRRLRAEIRRRTTP